jgi:hypothetical protein
MGGELLKMHLDDPCTLQLYLAISNLSLKP